MACTTSLVYYSTTEMRGYHFLAARTNGRAYATVLRLSVCRLSVALCIVAKRCVLVRAEVTIESL